MRRHVVPSYSSYMPAKSYESRSTIVHNATHMSSSEVSTRHETATAHNYKGLLRLTRRSPATVALLDLASVPISPTGHTAPPYPEKGTKPKRTSSISGKPSPPWHYTHVNIAVDTEMERRNTFQAQKCQLHSVSETQTKTIHHSRAAYVSYNEQRSTFKQKDLSGSTNMLENSCSLPCKCHGCPKIVILLSEPRKRQTAYDFEHIHISHKRRPRLHAHTSKILAATVV